MKATNYTLTIRVSLAGPLVHSALLGGLLVLAVMSMACLLWAG